MKSYKCITVVSLLIFMSFYGCFKKELELKPDQSMALVSTVSDYQSLLDQENNSIYGQAFLGELSSDDYYMELTFWNSRNITARNAYIWAEDIYEGAYGNDWASLYKKIYSSNVVLEGLTTIDNIESQNAYNTAKGCALFFRAKAFWELAQLFTVPYNMNTVNENLGIPLKLSSNVLETVPRGTLNDTYQQILKDAQEAADLLPVTLPSDISKNRPSKATAYTLLARIHLSMRQYEMVLKHSNEALQYFNEFIDYNDLDVNLDNPFPTIPQNKEIMLAGFPTGNGVTGNSNLLVDSNLFKSYEDNDLRKQIYFRDLGNGRYTSKTSYFNFPSSFFGLATDEVILMRAEAYARLGSIAEAMRDLNVLLINRYDRESFIPFTADSEFEALDIILSERRKELIFRGLRWIDLRRFNQEGANIVLTRNLEEQIYTLPPNSPKYVLPIPNQELEYNPIEQNNRSVN